MENVESMQVKKKKLEAVADLMAPADGYAGRAEATGDIAHGVNSNSPRKTAKAKAEELGSIKTQIESKLKDLPLASKFHLVV